MRTATIIVLFAFGLLCAPKCIAQGLHYEWQMDDERTFSIDIAVNGSFIFFQTREGPHGVPLYDTYGYGTSRVYQDSLILTDSFSKLSFKLVGVLKDAAVLVQGPRFLQQIYFKKSAGSYASLNASFIMKSMASAGQQSSNNRRTTQRDFYRRADRVAKKITSSHLYYDPLYGADSNNTFLKIHGAAFSLRTHGLGWFEGKILKTERKDEMVLIDEYANYSMKFRFKEGKVVVHTGLLALGDLVLFPHAARANYPPSIFESFKLPY